MRMDYARGKATCPVEHLTVGQRVDLEGDRFADPEHDNVLLAYEWQEVVEVVRETPGCVVVYFTDFTCGFPPDHAVDVDPEQVQR